MDEFWREHIDIRYFFIKDRIGTEGITIRHCPTNRMLADFFTKPLQGNLFRTFRDIILGYQSIEALDRIHSTLEEERVESMRSSDSETGASKEQQENSREVSDDERNDGFETILSKQSS